MRHFVLAFFAYTAGVHSLLEIKPAATTPLRLQRRNDSVQTSQTEFVTRFRAAERPASKACYLFIGMYLNPVEYWRADFIRNTSMSNLTQRFQGSVDMKFVVGLREIPDWARTGLLEVQEKHGDMLLLDIPDSYNQLTGKTAAYLQWVAENSTSSAKYFMKADDDSFIHLAALVGWLVQHERVEKSDNTVYGLLRQHRRVLRPSSHEKKWQEKWLEEDYDRFFYPDYADGGGYVFTRSLAEMIAGEFWDIVQENMYHNEDASFGIWNHLINKTLHSSNAPKRRYIHYMHLPMWKKRCRRGDIITGDVSEAMFDCFWQKELENARDPCCLRKPQWRPPKQAPQDASAQEEDDEEGEPEEEDEASAPQDAPPLEDADARTDLEQSSLSSE